MALGNHIKYEAFEAMALGNHTKYEAFGYLGAKSPTKQKHSKACLQKVP